MQKNNDLETGGTVEEQEVTFITSISNLTRTGVELHTSAGEKFAKKAGEVKQDYNAIINQISFIIADTDEQIQDTGFKLDEIKVSLGFSAKGKIGFIAEAGVEAAIEVSFKRK